MFCLHVYLWLLLHSVPTEARRKHWNLWKYRHRQMWAPRLVLEIESTSSKDYQVLLIAEPPLHSNPLPFCFGQIIWELFVSFVLLKHGTILQIIHLDFRSFLSQNGLNYCCSLTVNFLFKFDLPLVCGMHVHKNS